MDGAGVGAVVVGGGKSDMVILVPRLKILWAHAGMNDGRGIHAHQRKRRHGMNRMGNATKNAVAARRMGMKRQFWHCWEQQQRVWPCLANLRACLASLAVVVGATVAGCHILYLDMTGGVFGTAPVLHVHGHAFTVPKTND